MSSGFDSLSLALFTTLSPAGVIAFIGTAIPLLFFSLEEDTRTRLNRYLALPYAIILIGFIASATHLGTPSNALHVFSGIGRSPLSNEVLCAVIFLFLAGSYWMISFKENFSLGLARIWLGASCLAGIALIAMTSLAYSVDTVITWSSPLNSVNLWLSALFAGPLLGIATCVCARFESPRYYRALLVIALLALVAGSVSLLAHNASLSSISNTEFSATELVPDYLFMIIGHIVSGAIGFVLTCASLRRGLDRRMMLILLIVACAFLFLSLLLPRIAFYELHMTAGF